MSTGASTPVSIIFVASRISEADAAPGFAGWQAARATETVTKAFQISGASAAEAAGGLRQFLQGIQSGTLRGEELNSILEQTPALADAIARGLGITRGELRQYGQEGRLTAEQVITLLPALDLPQP